MHAGSQNPSSVQTQPRTQMPEAVSQFLGTSEKPAVVERIVEEPQPMIIEPIEQKPEDNKPKQVVIETNLYLNFLTIGVLLIQDDHSRCWSCKKKVNLLGVKCKCEFTFCNKHRMPEDHTCEFDHAFFGRE